MVSIKMINEAPDIVDGNEDILFAAGVGAVHVTVWFIFKGHPALVGWPLYSQAGTLHSNPDSYGVNASLTQFLIRSSFRYHSLNPSHSQWYYPV